LATRLQRELAHHLEAGQAGAQVLLRQPQQLTAASSEGTAAQAVSVAICRHGIQLHGGAGDHAQRAFAADEQVAQVVAGVVLAQARRPSQTSPCA
jgi:hypothetical protein